MWMCSLGTAMVKDKSRLVFAFDFVWRSEFEQEINNPSKFHRQLQRLDSFRQPRNYYSTSTMSVPILFPIFQRSPYFFDSLV